MRADIHGGPEQKLQSEAGYIDARPQTDSSTKTSCNARPDHTNGSKTEVAALERHVRCILKSRHRQAIPACPFRAKKRHPQLHGCRSCIARGAIRRRFFSYRCTHSRSSCAVILLSKAEVKGSCYGEIRELLCGALLQLGNTAGIRSAI